MTQPVDESSNAVVSVADGLRRRVARGEGQRGVASTVFRSVSSEQPLIDKKAVVALGVSGDLGEQVLAQLADEGLLTRLDNGAYAVAPVTAAASADLVASWGEQVDRLVDDLGAVTVSNVEEIQERAFVLTDIARRTVTPGRSNSTAGAAEAFESFVRTLAEATGHIVALGQLTRDFARLRVAGLDSALTPAVVSDLAGACQQLGMQAEAAEDGRPGAVKGARQTVVYLRDTLATLPLTGRATPKPAVSALDHAARATPTAGPSASNPHTLKP